MAKYNEILVGRYNRFIQKLLDMKGGPPAPTLSGDIQAGFDIEQIPVELRVLMSYDRYWFNLVVTGVAVDDSSIQLRNPVGSNVVAVLESLKFGTTNNAALVVWSIGNGAVADLSNVFAPGRIDNRAGTTKIPIVLSSQNSVAPGADLATPNGQIVLTVGMNEMIQASQNQELVLAPNNAWRFRNSAPVQNTFYFYAIMRCRALEASELLVT